MATKNELLRQCKKFLNSERISYIDAESELILILGGRLCSIAVIGGKVYPSHLVDTYEVGTLKEFIELVRSKL